jgi:hypothetical protein
VPTKSVEAVIFWRKVYRAKRGPLDVRAACDGLSPRQWFERHQGAYPDLWDHCVSYFSTAEPVPKSWLPPANPADTPTPTPTHCPRCDKGWMDGGRDRWGEYGRCLICGYHT